jgi:hypothetical protein
MAFRSSALLSGAFAVGLGVACTHFADTAELRVVNDAAVSDSDAPDSAVLETSGEDVASGDTRVPRVDAVIDASECVDLDGDGDGHAARSSGLACADDCNDDNPDVFPGQSKWFSFHADISDFDWDCNGVEEKRFVTRAKCELSGGACAFAEGWADAVPSCGVTADWITACSKLPSGACGATVERRVQECH